MWQKKLRTASFRKVRFHLTNSETTGGRRTANHIFPKRDEPYTEDLGRKAKEFQIDAFVLGDDYLRDRDKLIKACEASGPGKLVHPYYGTKNVVCTGLETVENANEGGCARMKLTFREAGSLKFPQARSNPKGLLTLLGSSINEASINEFLDTYGVAAQPGWVVDKVQDKVTSFTEDLEATADIVNRVADETADLAFAITDLRSDLDAIIHTPSVLASRIQNSISLLSASISVSKDSAKAYRGLFGFGSADTLSPIRTSTRIQSESNDLSVNKLISRAALVYGSIDLSTAEFESVQDADDFRQAYFDELERQQNLDNTSDDVYQLFQQLKVELAAAVPKDGESLPNIINLPIPITTNSIVLAYDLYESMDRESDIVLRNGIKNPAFIPGGETIQVLRDV